MKKYIYSLGVLFALLMSLVSCSSDDDEPTLSLAALPTKLEFTSDAGTKSVAVKAENVKWEAEASANWITYKISADEESELLVSVKENKENEVRTGKITLHGSGVSDVVIEVVQAAYTPEPTLSVEQKELEFNYEGKSLALEVTAQNVDWKVNASDSWIAFKVNPDNPSELLVTPTKNESGQDREGELTLSGKGVQNVVVRVIQHRDFANSKVIWENNSRYFAKLIGNVSFVDFTDYYGRNVNFDEEGFVKDFILKMQDNKGQEYEFTVKYEYTSDRRISKIYTQGIAVDFIYGDHTNYVEVNQDVFGPIGLSSVYLFLPNYIRGLKGIVATHPEATLSFTFDFSGDQLSVLADNELWRKATYKEGFPVKKEYVESGQKRGEDGKIKKYINHISQNYSFNPENGKVSKVVTDEEYEFEDKSLPNEKQRTTYTYLSDKYNNIETEGPTIKYTYDSYGDWDRIVAKTPKFENVDQYEYTRDEVGNWTRRIDRANFNGEEWNYDDKRSVKYFK